MLIGDLPIPIIDRFEDIEQLALEEYIAYLWTIDDD